LIIGFGLSEHLILLVWFLFAAVIGQGFPVALNLLLVQINKRIKSLEVAPKRDV
jgi:hypothetical protein